MPLYISQSSASVLPLMVNNELSKLPADRQREFVEEYNRKEKSVSTAYLLWLLLGWHYAYINKWPLQILFWISLGGVGIWWFIDAFRMQNIIDDENRNIAVSVIRDMKIIGG